MHYLPPPAIIHCVQALTTKVSDDESSLDQNHLIVNQPYLSTSFRIWPNASDESLRSAPANSELFKGDELGNSSVLEFRDWVVASLRLMHPDSALTIPQNPTIKLTMGTDAALDAQAEDFGAKVQEMNDQLDNIADRVDRLKSRIGESHERATLLHRQSSLQDDVKSADRERQIYLDGLANQQKKIDKARQNLEQARTQSFWCRIGIFCGWSTRDEEKDVVDQKDESMGVQKLVDDAEKNCQDKVADLKQNIDRIAEIAADLAQADDDTYVSLNNAREDLQAKVEQQRTQIRALSSFVPTPLGDREVSSLLRACPRPLRYHGITSDEDEQHRHPFFAGNVDSELEPDDSSELFVCPDANNRIASVHIIQDDKEFFSSEITSDANGAVSRIVIRNRDGHLLEDHQWVQLGGSKIRYGVSFYTDEDNDATLTSTFTDVNK